MPRQINVGDIQSRGFFGLGDKLFGKPKINPLLTGEVLDPNAEMPLRAIEHSPGVAESILMPWRSRAINAVNQMYLEKNLDRAVDEGWAARAKQASRKTLAGEVQRLTGEPIEAVQNKLTELGVDNVRNGFANAVQDARSKVLGNVGKEVGNEIDKLNLGFQQFTQPIRKAGAKLLGMRTDDEIANFPIEQATREDARRREYEAGADALEQGRTTSSTQDTINAVRARQANQALQQAPRKERIDNALLGVQEQYAVPAAKFEATAKPTGTGWFNTITGEPIIEPNKAGALNKEEAARLMMLLDAQRRGLPIYNQRNNPVVDPETDINDPEFERLLKGSIQ